MPRDSKERNDREPRDPRDSKKRIVRAQGMVWYGMVRVTRCDNLWTQAKTANHQPIAWTWWGAEIHSIGLARKGTAVPTQNIPKAIRSSMLYGI